MSIVAQSTEATPSTGRLSNWLVDKRVSISSMLFAALIVENIITGRRPHAIANLHDPWTVGGLISLFAGLAVRSWAAGVLRKGRELTTTGPYQLCRHPLYLGSFLMMFGIGLILNDPLYFATLIGPILAIYWVTMRREERRLAQKHGEAWSRYAAHSWRLLPFAWPRSLAIDWSFAEWRRNREYNAVIGVVLALAALHFWSIR